MRGLEAQPWRGKTGIWGGSDETFYQSERKDCEPPLCHGHREFYVWAFNLFHGFCATDQSSAFVQPNPRVVFRVVCRGVRKEVSAVVTNEIERSNAVVVVGDSFTMDDAGA